MSNIFSSSIGKKLVMSITGLFLIIFLVVHLVINLTALIGREAYEAACNLMENPVILAMVPVLAAGFAIHIIYSIIITMSNMKARPVRYAVDNNAAASSWASRNMFVLGLIVLGFLGLHLSHFWAKMQLPHFIGGEAQNPYDLVKGLFSQPLYCAIYIVWIVALYFHISHGFWSAFQTLGANNSKWIPRLQCIAKVYAIVVSLGFISIPIFFLLGLGE